MDERKKLEKIVSLCKQRGFVFQSSEIYGGINGCYDFGPLGVEVLNNIKNYWWKTMTGQENIVGLDASIIMSPKVWEASGHVKSFSDPMVDCRSCKARFRIDDLDQQNIEQCPKCGKQELTTPKNFNLMFQTHIGPSVDSSSVAYLRPETAQGIYVNFNNVVKSTRQKVPFGIAQIGKAFRKEINTKNFLFRVREFEQMEMQYFIPPGTDEKWFEYWREQRINWYKEIGIADENLQVVETPAEDRAHYAKRAADIEYKFPFGFQEIEGIHNRTDYDLTKHQKFSGKKCEYFDPMTQKRYVPYILETSVGATRLAFAVICDALHEDEVKGEVRTILRFHPKIAPIKVAIFPLTKGEKEKARKIYEELNKQFKCIYDVSGSIGKRYRRQDEIGTPYCVTVDGQSLEDGTVTVRDRDTMGQERIAGKALKQYLAEKLNL